MTNIVRDKASLPKSLSISLPPPLKYASMRTSAHIKN